jgi:SAM-dependent methyltransferase
MRNAAETELGGYAGFVSKSGTAEHTGLKEQSMDAVTAAQAFHWFDARLFKTECRRILKPGCCVALVWNSRDAASPLVSENGSIIRRHCPDFKGFSGGMDDDPEKTERFFCGGYEYRTFRHDLKYDLDGFIGRNLSASYAPKQGDAAYEPFVHEITELFSRYSRDGNVLMPNVTRSYIGRV